MTFRCSENDIFVDEKLLKPYGRLWVGNPVVTCSYYTTITTKESMFVGGE